MSAHLDSAALAVAIGCANAAALIALAVDLRRNNAQIGALMKLVWLLTAAYSGPLGLCVYFAAGRRQIARDSIWRRGLRSTAHCYAGCGLGEALGVAITVGVFAGGQRAVAVVTFVCAYTCGLALTVGPLLHDGESLRDALRDALASESASIVAMEVVAIAVDLIFGGTARPPQPRFFLSLSLSLSAGFVAAYPANLLLLRFGVKEGMHDPRRVAGATR